MMLQQQKKSSICKRMMLNNLVGRCVAPVMAVVYVTLRVYRYCL